MPNTNNRISVQLTTAQKQTIRDKVTELKTLLSWLISLGGERKIPQLGEPGIPWDGKLREYEVTHGAQVPAYVSLPELAKDRDTFDFTSELERLVEPLLEDIKDTRALTSNEVYLTDLQIYHAFEAAAAAGVPGMDTVFADLQARFPKAFSRTPRPAKRVSP